MRFAFMFALVTASSSAYAQAPVTTPHATPGAPTDAPASPTETVTVTYRGHTLLADGAALGLALAGASSQSGGVLKLSLATYVFGAPVVHAAHSNGFSFFASVALRVGLPLVGGMIAASTQPKCQFADETLCSDDEFVGPGVATGILIGMVGAMIIDHSVLAKHEVERARRPARTVVPTASAAPGGATFGLTGTF